eukprot:6181719-Pleurochrysis_carterae.AAC.1
MHRFVFRTVPCAHARSLCHSRRESPSTHPLCSLVLFSFPPFIVVSVRFWASPSLSSPLSRAPLPRLPLLFPKSRATSCRCHFQWKGSHFIVAAQRTSGGVMIPEPINLTDRWAGFECVWAKDSRRVAVRKFCGFERHLGRWTNQVFTSAALTVARSSVLYLQLEADRQHARKVRRGSTRRERCVYASSASYLLMAT